MSTNKRLKTAHGSPIVKDFGSSAEAPSASVSDLPNDLLKQCFSFIPGQYITVAPVCRHFFSNYCTVGMGESETANSADALFQISRNKRTTADAVSNDVHLTELSFILDAPKEFIYKVCNKAARKRHRDVIECAVAFGVEHGYDKDMFTLDRSVLGRLAEDGDLDMLKFLNFHFRLSSRNISGHALYLMAWERILYGAARRGRIDILDWMTEVVCFDFLFESEYSYESIDEIMRACYRMGSYESVVWWRKQFGSRLDEIEDNECMSLVAESGNVELLRHVQKNLFERSVSSEEIFARAARSGNIEMLKYCYQNSFPFNEDVCGYVLDNIHNDHALQVLKWLRRHNFPWNEKTCSFAAKHENLDALKWARSAGCPWNEITFAVAAKNGNIEMLEYCLDNGCPMDAKACELAVTNGDDLKALETLKWLRKHSCPWDERTYQGAFYCQNFSCLIFAHKNGCPRAYVDRQRIIDSDDLTAVKFFLQVIDKEHIPYYYREMIRRDASDSLIIEKLRLFREYGHQWSADFCASAAAVGKLKILQWLRYHDCSWDVQTCNSAVQERNFEVLKYAHKNGCEWNKHTFAYCMAAHSIEDEVGKIPTKPRSGMGEIYDYLVRHDCPKPDTSDWRIKTSEPSDEYSDESFDDYSDDDSYDKFHFGLGLGAI